MDKFKERMHRIVQAATESLPEENRAHAEEMIRRTTKGLDDFAAALQRLQSDEAFSLEIKKLLVSKERSDVS